MPVERRTSLCHWGAFEAEIESGRLTAARPWRDGGADPEMIGAWPGLVYSKQRIDRPHVRESFLKRREHAGGDGRGSERMIPVDWETALDLVAEQIRRVHAEHGARSVFGGSYGWSSAGRFHHARTQLRRFHAAAGGFTDQVGNYSWGAAHALLPHVLGNADAVSSAATSWRTIAEHTDVLVAFGGLNPKNWRVTSGGAGNHHMPRYLADAAARGVRFIVVSPYAGDVPEGLGATWIAPRPNTDTAILLALAHELLVEDDVDHEFLAACTVGHERFFDYLRGADDGVPKSLPWAARISGVAEEQLRALSEAMRGRRVMLTASWSLQRADHGEQPFWAVIALAAMLGQIGLPGGGFTFGYGSLNGVGANTRRGYAPAMPLLPNPAAEGAIPVACITDCLLHPGREIAFNGQRIVYPDVRLVHWAGGNPFHHVQDLFRLRDAWRRPETVVVQEPWWTPAARHADIVLPATTTAERNDIGGSSRDPFVFAMPKLVEPVGSARDDFLILRDLSERLGCRQAFDEGLDEEGWLRRLWDDAIRQGVREGVDVPDFDSFWQAGHWPVPAPDEPEVLLAAFRADPDAHRLATPSGRIELYSETIGSFGHDDSPPHPAWLAPHEWLGEAEDGELHLLSHQPARQLHSQLYQVTGATPERVEINARDASARGIADGDLVRLWNRRGACLARAKVGDLVRPGVLVMPTGAWFAPDPDEERFERNGNPNVLTADRRTSQLGQACAAMSTLVRVAPYERREATGAERAT